jgi:hypothetical protein
MKLKDPKNEFDDDTHSISTGSSSDQDHISGGEEQAGSDCGSSPTVGLDAMRLLGVNGLSKMDAMKIGQMKACCSKAVQGIEGRIGEYASDWCG